MSRIWDYTTLNYFLTCRKKYYWRMVRHLDLKTVAPALEFGKVVHSALDIYYTEGIEKAIVHFRETYKDREGEELRTVANGVKLIEEYAQVYKNEPFKIIAKPESGFVFPIGDILWGGRLDLPVEWGGDMYVMEHKTTTRLTSIYFKQFDLNMQISSYTLAAEEFFHRKCYGCVINVLEPWKEVKRVTVKTKKPEQHFARAPIPRSQAQKDLFRLTVQQIIRDIQWCEKNNEFYPNEASCFFYNYDCPYKTLCQFGDNPRFVERDYQESKWEPYKQLVEGK